MKPRFGKHFWKAVAAGIGLLGAVLGGPYVIAQVQTQTGQVQGHQNQMRDNKGVMNAPVYNAPVYQAPVHRHSHTTIVKDGSVVNNGVARDIHVRNEGSRPAKED